MSWDVTLYREREAGTDWPVPLDVPRHTEGGTYVMGGSPRACLNVTYNYGARYREHLPPADSNILVTMLDGKTAAETIPLLERLVAALGTERDRDYWQPTAGNAGYALSILLAWARLYPDAHWDVT